MFQIVFCNKNCVFDPEKNWLCQKRTQGKERCCQQELQKERVRNQIYFYDWVIIKSGIHILLKVLLLLFILVCISVCYLLTSNIFHPVYLQLKQGFNPTTSWLWVSPLPLDITCNSTSAITSLLYKFKFTLKKDWWFNLIFGLHSCLWSSFWFRYLAFGFRVSSPKRWFYYPNSLSLTLDITCNSTSAITSSLKFHNYFRTTLECVSIVTNSFKIFFTDT